MIRSSPSCLKMLVNRVMVEMPFNPQKMLGEGRTLAQIVRNVV